MKIAIIGSGISGLYAAWQLSKQHQVTVFEKNHYFGGHTECFAMDSLGYNTILQKNGRCWHDHKI